LGVPDGFKEVARQVRGQFFAASLGNPVVLGPAEEAALLHRELEPREGSEKPQRFVGREAVEELMRGKHALCPAWSFRGMEYGKNGLKPVLKRAFIIIDSSAK
jgi:hypothetical protein